NLLEPTPFPYTTLFRSKLLEAMARDRPLIVVVDDLHWAESTFLDLIEQLRDLVVDAPVLLVCSARPDLLEVRPTWGVEENAARRSEEHTSELQSRENLV